MGINKGELVGDELRKVMGRKDAPGDRDKSDLLCNHFMAV